MPPLHLAAFTADITPPPGHPLCGGWIEPVRDVDDPLEAVGVVLLGAGQPVVLCALDWCILGNDAHERVRQVLAKAAHTVPAKVAVHCVHQHNAPMVDVEAQRIAQGAAGAPQCLDLQYFDRAVDAVVAALTKSLGKTSAFTHIGVGQGRVSQVASNRRILGPDGKIRFTRTSATRDPKIRAEPEGLIDSELKTLSFWNDKQPLAALHYYATHPMSYYGDGRVSSDFCGLARRHRLADDPTIFQVYFTGCAGNITAGKYNDGSRGMRKWLRDRIYAGMQAAWQATVRHPVKSWQWRTEAVHLPSRTEASFSAEQCRKVLTDGTAARAARGHAAFKLAWLARQKRPIEVTCLDFGRALVLHLPGEPFIEYQLHAQQLRKDTMVLVAGYGDGGPWYIPTAEAYGQGGYEPSVAFTGPKSEAILRQAMVNLLQAKPK
jgi:hypothetical protein